MLERAEIAKRIPHAGSMCLLDRVIQYDDNAITCSASSHRDSGNPLLCDGQLPTLCGIEYAAQAMALHGALTGTINEVGGTPRAGYLAALRDVKTTRARLDDLPGELTIEARQMMGDGNQMIYNFSLGSDGRLILSGRATVILEAV